MDIQLWNVPLLSCVGVDRTDQLRTDVAAATFGLCWKRLDGPDVEADMVNLRSLGRVFDDTSSKLVSSAAALLNWHGSSRFS